MSIIRTHDDTEGEKDKGRAPCAHPKWRRGAALCSTRRRASARRRPRPPLRRRPRRATSLAGARALRSERGQWHSRRAVGPVFLAAGAAVGRRDRRGRPATGPRTVVPMDGSGCLGCAGAVPTKCPRPSRWIAPGGREVSRRGCQPAWVRTAAGTQTQREGVMQWPGRPQRPAKQPPLDGAVAEPDQSVQQGRYTQEDPAFPVVRIRRHRVAQRMGGVASGRSACRLSWGAGATAWRRWRTAQSCEVQTGGGTSGLHEARRRWHANNTEPWALSSASTSIALGIGALPEHPHFRSPADCNEQILTRLLGGRVAKALGSMSRRACSVAACSPRPDARRPEASRPVHLWERARCRPRHVSLFQPNYAINRCSSLGSPSTPLRSDAATAYGGNGGIPRRATRGTRQPLGMLAGHTAKPRGFEARGAPRRAAEKTKRRTRYRLGKSRDPFERSPLAHPQ